MNFLKPLICFIVTGVAIVLSGCMNTKYYENFTSSIDDTTWVPLYVQGQESVNIPSTTRENLEAFLHLINRGYGRYVINGRGGVNNFTGSMDIRDDQTIVFAPLATTLKMGTHYAYEAKFIAALREVERAEVTGDTMILYKMAGANKVVLMKLQKLVR